MTETRGGTFDQVSYDALAQRVTGGYGFSFAQDNWPHARADQPTAFWSYIYTLYLAGIYGLFGHQPLLARLVQAVVVGILTPWLTFRIAGRIFDRPVALISAAITAIYAYFILYAGSLMTEAAYIVGILWCFDSVMRVAERVTDQEGQGRRFALLGIELGVAMGFTVLLRQVFFPFLVVMVMWLLWTGWRRGSMQTMIAPIVVSALVMALILSPFIARNYRVFGRLTMPNTNTGFAFFWSNHPIYGTKFEPVLSAEHGVSYQGLIPAELRELNEAELDRALLKEGIRFVLDEPLRYAQLSLSRIPVYFLFWPTEESSTLSNLARVLSFGLFLPFMIGGMWLAIRNLPREYTRKNEVLNYEYTVLLLFFILVYTAIHLASWANVRYRLPVDAFLIIFAAYAIVRVYARWFAPRISLVEGRRLRRTQRTEV